MEYIISTERHLLQMDVVHALLAASYLSPGIRRDIVETAARNSLVVGAYERSSGAQVGYARAITDHATFAYLCDVIVAEPHRNKGLASRMVEALEQTPTLGTLRRWCLATRDAHAVYAKRGYTPVPEGRWMEKKFPDAGWRDPS